MTLSIGTRLGPYEVLSPLGTGGMGEVYRARDARLDRTVAVKVLPEHFAQDPDRRARFEREAKLLAALNHPGIAHVYGFETAALPDGGSAHFLAMELVPGEDLATRLTRGPIPVDEAIEIARQITEALEEAHEKGIVHRDLKPANVKLTPEGKVKVLDFGLAKAWAGDSGSATSSADLSQSPTLAHTGTQAGVILGTAAYMSPEQARGKPVDRRADIWAFGVLLFEMLTGRRLFEDETVSDTLAAVLRQEIPWPALPAETPAAVNRLLHRCLERDPKQRLRDVGEARIALGDARAHGDATGVEAAVPIAAKGPLWRRALPWAPAALGLSLAALALWAPWRRPASPASLTRLSVELGADAWLEVSETSGAAVVLSPDGSMLSFVGRSTEGDRPRLFVRRLDQLQATPLVGTEGARDPFFSPDGQWIAFFADGHLKRIAMSGGSPFVLAEASFARGGSWGDDGSIVFAPNSSLGFGLSRVPSSGGAAEVVTKPGAGENENNDRWPQVLPGGRALLFTAKVSPDGFEDAHIVVQALPNGPRKVIVSGGYHGRYVPSGHVLYVHAGTLFAVPFDLARFDVTGAPVAVIEEIVSSPAGGGAQIAFSDRGTVAYLPGRGPSGMSTIQWLDRTGRLSPLRATPGRYFNLRFSPDGTRLAFQIGEDKAFDFRIDEWRRNTLSRLTFDVVSPSPPVWSPDGRGLVYTGVRGEAPGNVYWRRADGTGDVQLLSESPNVRMARSWHPSGRYLALTEQSALTNLDVTILPIEGDGASGWRPGRPSAFVSGKSSEAVGGFSPDGRWLAYASAESGRFQVYVRPFPASAGQWQVSTEAEGVRTGEWSANGREIFYQALDGRLMVAEYSVEGGAFHAGTPRPWCETRVPIASWMYRTFDLHPDGQRFAIIQPVAEPADARHRSVVLVQNFFDELRRVAPPK